MCSSVSGVKPTMKKCRRGKGIRLTASLRRSAMAVVPSARGVAGIGDAVAVHGPNLVVIAGGYLDDDTVARWAYAVRLAAGALPVAVYRRGDQRVRMRTTGTSVLPSGAGEAQRRMLELVEADQAEKRAATAEGTRASSAQLTARTASL